MLRISVVIAAFFFAIQPVLAKPVTVLALGDSLTAGYGLAEADAFPAKLGLALKSRGHDVVVINGGVSGDTAADGLARLDWSLTPDVDAAIVELGANDALRGLPVAQAEAALDAILLHLGGRKIPVLLAGMRAPPNLGPGYVKAFDGMFARLSEKHGAILYPFFLDGVVAQSGLNQEDGIHPRAPGVDIIVSRILPSVEQLIRKAEAK